MFTLNCRGRLLVIDKPVVMGIINITPDSFYDGSRSSTDGLVQKASQMIADGATIIDVGGQSTRPGSERVPAATELQRVLPAVDMLHRTFPELFISIDTYHAEVAREAVAAGASIVNDVTAGRLDNHLIDTVADLQVPYVLTHSKGEPQNMQQLAQYDNVTLEVFDALNFTMASLVQRGIHDIIIDPGFGFAKTAAHNFTLLRELEYLGQLGKPVLAGLSRKATIYKTLGVTAGEALNGSTVLHTIALLHGASILRVHDVKEAMEAVRLVTALQQKEQP